MIFVYFPAAFGVVFGAALLSQHRWGHSASLAGMVVGTMALCHFINRRMI